MTFEVGVGYNLESDRELPGRLSQELALLQHVTPFMSNKAEPIVYKLQATHNSVTRCHFNTILQSHVTRTATQLRYADDVSNRYLFQVTG